MCLRWEEIVWGKELDQGLQTLRVCLPNGVPQVLQSKGCLLSFLRGKVARLEREVSKPFLKPRGLCCHLPLYLLVLRQRQGLPVSRVRKQHENWPHPHNSRESMDEQLGCREGRHILQKQTGLF